MERKISTTSGSSASSCHKPTKTRRKKYALGSDPARRDIGCNTPSRTQTEYLHPFRGISSAVGSLSVSHEWLVPAFVIVLLTLILLANAAEAIGGPRVTKYIASFSLRANMRVEVTPYAQRHAEAEKDERVLASMSMAPPCYGFVTDDSAQFLTGPEMEAVYVAIDALRDLDEYKDIGNALMANAHMLRTARLEEHIRGSTPFFTQGGFLLNQSLIRRVIDGPDSPVAIAELASTLAHEYVHTQQLGAGRTPLAQSLHQMTYGILYTLSLPMEYSGVGFADQNGTRHGLFEIRPWLVGNDVEQKVFDALRREQYLSTEWNYEYVYRFEQTYSDQFASPDGP